VYALLAIAVVWMHYLFALVLVPQALYTFVRLRRGETEVSVRRLAAVAVIVVAGIVPLAVQIASLWDRRSTLSIPSDASVQLLAVMLLPPVLVASLFLGSLIARLSTPVRIARAPARSSTLVLLVTWLVFPVVTLFLISSLTSVDFLSLRYFNAAGADSEGEFGEDHDPESHLIPLVLERFNADPAVSSGVFVTTVTDVVGFFSFLGIATLWFGLK